MSAAPQPHQHDPRGRTGHEPSDLPIRTFVWIAAIFLACAIVFQFALFGLMRYFDRQIAERFAPPSPVAATQPLPPPPRLQVSPETDLAELRAAERRTLESYGWVDRDKGIVRIPIDRAMSLIAERGLPASAPKEAP